MKRILYASWQLLIAAGLCLAGLPRAGVAAEPASPDWWQAQRELNSKLVEQGASISTLVKNVSGTKPANASEAMFKLSLLMRAGMNRDASATLRELKALCPALENYQVSSIYYDATDHLLAWDVAKATVEVFAENVAELDLQNRLLKHLLESGWSVEQVDAWLAAKPEGVQSFWIKERLRFNSSHGRADALVKALGNRVRQNPKDIIGAITFLDALIYAREGQRTEDVSWIGTSIKPTRATEASDLASRLQNLADWATAIVFYRQAISIPLTEEEVSKLGMMRQIFMPGPQIRADFAASNREGMAKCLLELGRNDEAQKWMVEAADIRQKNNLGRNALLAGETQARSGQHTIEGKIKEEEKKSQNDPEYWRERAEYYRGRNEPPREEETLKKGLALTKPQARPKQVSKGHTDWRSSMLLDYAHFLQRQKRNDDAVALLRRELQQAPAEAESTQRAAYLLAFDFPDFVRAGDDVLWRWLANQPKWEYTEERLLWKLLENAKGNNLEAYFSRAEGLARGKDPSRAQTLGWIMNRMNFAGRSIPLLQDAVANAQAPELKEKAAFSLLESYLDTGDWKKAETIFPEASRRLTSWEMPEWYARIALAAAKAGAKQDALRIWTRLANINPSAIRDLDQLARLGLRPELVTFYQQMQQKLPGSEIPAKALKELEQGR